MKQKNTVGDYTNTKELAFLPSGGIPKKLDKDKHALLYAWTEEGSNEIKLGEVTDAVHGRSPQEAFESRYNGSKSSRLSKMVVLRLFVIPKNPNKARGYDDEFRRYINKYNLSFFCPGDDGNGNTERVVNFNVEKDFDKLEELMANYYGFSSSLKKQFTYRNDTQENIGDECVNKLLTKFRVILNGHTGLGKSTISLEISARVCGIGGICLHTTPIADTLYDLSDKTNTTSYSVPKVGIGESDIKGKTEKQVLDMINDARKNNQVDLYFTVQNVRFGDKDADTQLSQLRKKFSFLKKIDLMMWSRDEYHKEYNGSKTSEIFSELKPKYILDQTATTYKLFALHNDYEPDQIMRYDDLWAIEQKHIAKNPDFKNFVDVGIACVPFDQPLPKKVRDIFTNVEDEYRAEKMFEVKDNQFVNITAIVETFKFISDEKFDGITKKNNCCALSDPMVHSKGIGMIKIPEGNSEFTAKKKCELLKNELNNCGITRTLYKTADDFLSNRKNSGTSRLLEIWKKEAKEKGCVSVAIITHGQLVTGTDIPELGYSYLFDKISSPDNFIQFLGRLRRMFDGKTSARCYVMCPGMHVQISSMMYNAIKDRYADNEKLQRMVYDNISLVHSLDGKMQPISFTDAIKNNDIMCRRAIESAGDITNQLFLKFDGLIDSLKDVQLDKILKYNFVKAKDSITFDNSGKTYVDSDDKNNENTIKNSTDKQDTKNISPIIQTLSTMYRTVPSLYVVDPRQDLEQIWNSDLAKLWFTDSQRKLAKKVLEFDGIRPSLNQWFEEKVKLFDKNSVHEIVLGEKCFLNEKFLVKPGMVYTPKVVAEEMIQIINKGNSFLVFNALNGMIPALLRKTYPNAKIVCVEYFPFFIKHLTNMGFETYLYTDKKWKNMRFNASVFNPPYNKNLDLKFITEACKVSDQVIVVHPAVSTISRRKDSGVFQKFKKEIDGKIKSMKIFNGNPVFGIRLAYPCQIMVIDNTVKQNKFTVKYSLDNVNTESYEFETIFDVTKWGNVKEYFSLENKILDYCNKGNNLENRKNPSNSSWYVKMAGLTGNPTTGEKEHIYDNDYFTMTTVKESVSKTVPPEKYKVFSFNTENEANNFLEYTRTNFARFALSIFKKNLHINSKELESVPDIGSYKEPLTKARLTKLFNITHTEWAFIDKVIPKYY